MSNLRLDNPANRILQFLSVRPHCKELLLKTPVAEWDQLVALMLVLGVLALVLVSPNLAIALLCTLSFLICATVWKHAKATDQQIWLIQTFPIGPIYLDTLPQAALLVSKMEKTESDVLVKDDWGFGAESPYNENVGFKNAGSGDFIQLYRYIKNWQTSENTKLHLLKFFLLNSNLKKSINTDCDNLQEALFQIIGNGDSKNTGNVNEDEAFLLQLISSVLANISNTNFCPAQLYKHMAMSSSQLHRRIKEVTNMTPGKIIRCCRLKAAKSMLLETDFQIADISFETGFKDPAYFTRLFTTEFGMSPSKFRKNGKMVLRHRSNR